MAVPVGFAMPEEGFVVSVAGFVGAEAPGGGGTGLAGLNVDVDGEEEEGFRPDERGKPRDGVRGFEDERAVTVM